MTPEQIYAALYRIREELTDEDGPRVNDAALKVEGLMQQLHGEVSAHITTSPSTSTEH